jgi:uncharacterized RDD family membrane protein YckC
VSTRASLPISRPSWKEEVNRRLAAHQSRKGMSVVEKGASQQEHIDVSDRAAKAAARVAARFSQAPSYAEMQAVEARAALREAEAATRAALEAQAAAQEAWAHVQRITENRAEFDEEQLLVETPLPETPAPVIDSVEPAEHGMEASTTESAETSAEIPQYREPLGEHPAQPLTPARQFGEAIHANLIHFPREIIATRRIRPRLPAADERAEEQTGQLSIFEVDPGSISIEPTASVATEEIAPAPSWSGPEWTGLDLEPDPLDQEKFDEEPPYTTARIHLAPLGLRLMAAAVDLALIVGLVCAGAAGIASHLHHAPAIKTAEIGGILALVLTGLLYHAFFLLATMSTPGMMYARIGVCTFDDDYPTHAQLRARLGALLVSLLPLGLGIAWAIFDEDHLSWHDRISRTYLRRC